MVDAVIERTLPATARLVGSLIEDRSALVAGEVSGIVLELPIREGDFVAAGATLCRLDAVPAELRLQEAVARADALQAQLHEMERGERPETLRRLESAVEEARAIREKWRFERERLTRLYSDRQANPKELHDAEMEFLAANHRTNMAEAQLEQGRNGGRAEQRAFALAQLAAQQAVVGQLRREVDRTNVRAPFAGFVVTRRTQVGEWLTVGGPVCVLMAIDQLRVRVDVPEAAAPFARVGAQVTLRIEALGDSMTLPISRVIPRAAVDARTFPIEIDVPNPERRFLPGMFVRAHVPIGASAARLLVNRDAILPAGNGAQVFVLRQTPEGAIAVPLPVDTGLEVEQWVEVRAPGLAAGDEVVVRANERLYGPGPVVPQRQPAASAPAAQP